MIRRRYIGERPCGEPELCVGVQRYVEFKAVRPVQQEVSYVLDFRFTHSCWTSVHYITSFRGRILYN